MLSTKDILEAVEVKTDDMSMEIIWVRIHIPYIKKYLGYITSLNKNSPNEAIFVG